MKLGFFFIVRNNCCFSKFLKFSSNNVIFTSLCLTTEIPRNNNSWSSFLICLKLLEREFHDFFETLMAHIGFDWWMLKPWFIVGHDHGIECNLANANSVRRFYRRLAPRLYSWMHSSANFSHYLKAPDTLEKKEIRHFCMRKLYK